MKRTATFCAHLSLSAFLFILFIPLYLAFVAASHDGQSLLQGSAPYLPGGYFFKNLYTVLSADSGLLGGQKVCSLMLHSLIMALSIAVGKIFLALTSAYALVYFDFPFKKFSFALIFLTMMLPIEVRILPTFQLIASLGLLNTYTALTLPLMATATGTFLFRQFFKTLPKELVDAAKMDGAGPFRFFFDMLLPLSKTQILALFVIVFVYGWNQYLWPLVLNADSSKATLVMAIHYLSASADEAPQWHYIMSIALLSLTPPCLLVLCLQACFEKGLKQ